ncbi:MAG: serine hydrolase [Flavobacteriaceae bacterium]|nr:serine hydrolase [Flavobacteriaceae bacterium]
MRKITLFFAFLITANSLFSQTKPLTIYDDTVQRKWVDSVMTSMTIDQKIGQLFMIAGYSNKDEKHTNFIKETIKKHEIGGLIFMQGTPEKQAKLYNEYQAISKVPLLIGFDGEWGLAMRLKETYRFPWNMTLGAIRDNTLIEKFGKHLGKQCKRIGIHLNFAPVVDINTNPKNPIIGNRSFGENRENVTEKAKAFIKGLQSEYVLANAKHFPGHGDTSTDSHKTLPQVNFDIKRLDSIELYPYQQLFQTDLASVMVAHLSVPTLEPNKTLPTSLSKKVVTDLLKEKMGFKGLILTDALNMKGASNFAKPGEIDLEALKAGNDILLFSGEVSEGVKAIKKALNEGVITEERINHSVRKILKAKYWAGLHHYSPVKMEGIDSDLNNSKNEVLYRELIENAVTLVKNKESILPIRNLEKQKIAYIKLGDDKDNSPFVTMLQNYTDVTVVSAKNTKELLKKLKPYNLVIAGFHKSDAHAWKDYHFSKNDLYRLKEVAKKKKIILDIFASPYSLLDINDFSEIEGLVVSYQNSPISQEISGQLIFGAMGFKGKLPVSVRNEFNEGHGLLTNSLQRLGYSIPEKEGLNSQNLAKIDSVAEVVLKEKMAPGMQVLVAKNGKIVFHKTYGYHTDKEKQKVQKKDLYDVASVTKILGTLPMVMQLEDQKKIKLEDTLGKLLPWLKNTNKDTLTLKEVLSHNARLKAWIPFYIKTLDSVTKKPSLEYYRKKWSKKFNIKVAENLYLRRDYKDTILNLIATAEQREKTGYKYSDLAFYISKEIVERFYKKDLNTLMQKYFYKPLGANRTTFLPLQKFPKNDIVPTEDDNYYRNQLLQGYVHDMGAAMLGGISGHAGLFSTAEDMAKMMQLFLQKGFYGGKRYFQPQTMDLFNTRFYEKDSIRRGVGFDKPQIRKAEQNTCGCVSEKSFGHGGFTGTYVWADPATSLIYIFLSNRVYPTMDNTKLVDEDIRTNIQQIIQDSLL